MVIFYALQGSNSAPAKPPQSEDDEDWVLVPKPSESSDMPKEHLSAGLATSSEFVKPQKLGGVCQAADPVNESDDSTPEAEGLS